MTTAPITLRRVAPAEAEACVDSLAEVLLDCVAGGASVGFMASLTADKARAFWRGVAQGVQRGERVLLVAEDASGRLVGTVQLLLNLPDNQPHRADVAKMLVHRRARRPGLAARLLALLEDEARRAGRTVLVLDTVTGGDAERLYTRAGWQPVGVVPRYALMPDGAFCGTTFFHKAL
jgi:GNAT superfamily N-acetyltransferase